MAAFLFALGTNRLRVQQRQSTARNAGTEAANGN